MTTSARIISCDKAKFRLSETIEGNFESVGGVPTPVLGMIKSIPTHSPEGNQHVLEQRGAPKPPGIQAKALFLPSCYLSIQPYFPRLCLQIKGSQDCPMVEFTIH